MIPKDTKTKIKKGFLGDIEPMSKNIKRIDGP